jgi:hypothetical protein
MASERSDAPVIDDLKFDEVRRILVTYESILIPNSPPGPVSDCTRGYYIASMVVDSREGYIRSGTSEKRCLWLVCKVLIRASLIQSQLQSSVTSLHEAFQRILLFVPSGNSKDHASATGLPQPGRPIRALISRCLVKLHQNVEDRSLFDFVQVLMKGVMENNANVLKHGQDLVYKV